MIRATLLLALVVGTFALTAQASPLDLPLRLNALETRLLADLASGRMTDASLLAASLVAGGATSDRELQRYTERFEQFCQKLEEATFPPAVQFQKNPDAALAYKLHRFLHENVLTGKYHAECNSVQRTLDTGDYNCVTATILFRCLADRCHLPVATLASATHVLCQTQGKEPFFVEMTTESSVASVRTETFVFLPTADGELSSPRGLPAPMKELSTAQVAAKIYYNRAVAALEQKDFEQAVNWLRTARCFDSDDETVLQNLLAGINNWALAECDAGNYGRAVELLEAGKKISADYAPFAANDLHIHQQWTLQLCRAHRFTEALTLLERGYERRPDAPLFEEGRLAVWQTWVTSLVEQKKNEDAQSVVERALRQFPENPSLQKMRHDLTAE